MLCPLYKSYTNGIIFFKLYSNVQLNKVICRTHVTIVPAQGQGHTWRSNLTCPLYKSHTNGRIFFKLYSNVQLNKVICRTHVTFVPAYGRGHTSLDSHIWLFRSINIIIMDEFSSNYSYVQLNKLCAEPSYLCAKVEVTF